LSIFWLPALIAVLAFGTVETWSLALFEINALVMALLFGLLQLIDRGFEWRRLWPSLPLWLMLGWALLQVVPVGSGSPTVWAARERTAGGLRLATISLDPQATT
jgi:hypothetical protein